MADGTAMGLRQRLDLSDQIANGDYDSSRYYTPRELKKMIIDK